MSRQDRSPRNGEYRTLTAEHADGWHDFEPVPTCPDCRRHAKEVREREAAKLLREYKEEGN